MSSRFGSGSCAVCGGAGSRPWWLEWLPDVMTEHTATRYAELYGVDVHAILAHFQRPALEAALEVGAGEATLAELMVAARAQGWLHVRWALEARAGRPMPVLEALCDPCAAWAGGEGLAVSAELK